MNFLRLFSVLLTLTALLPATEPVGRRDLRIHDPSTIVQADGTWWIFGTGRLLNAARSTDLQHWKKLPSPLSAPPAWAGDAAPDNKSNYYWAPDIIHRGNLYYLYYSVSEFGKNNSAIGLATSPTLNPQTSGYAWTDRGIVIRSVKGDHFNAIDPSILADTDGHLWMAFGSFWNGLFIVELNPATGLRIAPESPMHQVARDTEIEAATLYKKDGYYYLFFDRGLCCRGVKSTYRIVVGRSRAVTGPYLDDQGRDLNDGGGRAFLGATGDFIGPGHAGLLRDAAGVEWVSVHFYDGSNHGAPTLALRRVGWTEDGWPRVID